MLPPPTATAIANNNAAIRSELSTSSPHGVVAYSPTLTNHSGAGDLHITCSGPEIRTVGVSFDKSAIISTQLERRTANTDAILVRLTEIDTDSPPHPPLAVSRALYNALLPYFAGGSDAPASYVVELPLPSLPLHAALMTLGASQVSPHYVLTRSVVFQLFTYAYSALAPIPFPYTPASITDISHPLRAPKPSTSSPLYSRIIPHLESSYFKLSLCTQNDLSILHSWLNDDRVDQFWMEKGTWEAHEKFLEDKKQDPHVIPVIGSYVVAKGGVVENSAPATYSEIYWVKEDRLGQYMAKDNLEIDDYDRGVHVLVGSNAHRGPHRVRAWLPSLVHYCFLDDARTRRVFAEPNQLNTKMVKYFESVGFVRHGSIVFPHKTSALMICERNAFYEKCPF